MTENVVPIRPGEVVPVDRRVGPQSVASLWELFFSWSGFSQYTPSARKNYKRAAALCEQLKLAPFPTSGDVAIWIERVRQLPGRKGKLMSPNTVTLHHDNLHAVFEWARAMGKGWCDSNPLHKRLLPFRRGVALRVAIRNLDETWPFVLAAAGRDVRWRGFLGVLRYLGIRKGEALALCAEDFSTDRAGVWWCSVTKQRHAHEWVTRPPKFQSRRPLPCRPELVQLIRPVLKAGAPTVKVGHGATAERTVPYLFPFREYDLAGMLDTLRGRLPEDFPVGDAWHVFRHTAAVEMERADVPPRKISEWLGHKSLRQTEKYLRTLTGKRVDASVLNYFTHPKAKGGSEPPEVKSTRDRRQPVPRADNILEKSAAVKRRNHPKDLTNVETE